MKACNEIHTQYPEVSSKVSQKLDLEQRRQEEKPAKLQIYARYTPSW